MNEDMNTVEALIKMTEENNTRKILEIVKECESVEEAVQKIKDLLNK